MKKNYNIFLLYAFLTLLTGCTLSLDEFLDDEEGKEINGDGWSSPRTEIDSVSSITYQFNEGTMLIDERHDPYIMKCEMDSTHDEIDIYFHRSVPADLIPEIGTPVATTLFDKFEGNICHKVAYLEEVNGMYKVHISKAKPGEVFKKLKFDYDFYVETDTIPDTTSATRGGCGYKIIGRPRPVRDYTRAFNFEESYTFVKINFGLDTNNESLLNHLKFDKIKENTFDRITRKGCKPYGLIDGGLYAEGAISFRLKCNYDKDKDYVNLHGWFEADLGIGFVLKEVRGGIKIPIIGSDSIKVKTPSEFGKDAPVTEFKKADFLFKSPKVEIALPTGPVKMDGKATLDLVADFYASLKADKWQPLQASKKVKFGEFGFFKKGDEEYSYPIDKNKNVPAEMDTDDSDECDLSFVAGIQITSAFHVGVEIYEILNIKCDTKVTFDAKYTSKLVSKYKLDRVNYDIYSWLPVDASNSDFSIDLSLELGFSGTVEFAIFSWTLFEYSALKVDGLIDKSWNIYPDFEISIIPDKEKTMNDPEHAYYNAVVKTTKASYLFDGNAPYLAIFTKKGKFLQMVKAKEFGQSLVKGHKYKYKFKVKLYDKDGAFVGSNLQAVAIQKWHIASCLHSTPVPFTLDGTYIQAYDMVQFKYSDSSSSLTDYAFGFGISARGSDKYDKYGVEITIYDKEDGFGNVLLKKSFSLANAGSKPDGYYLVKFKTKGYSDKYIVKVEPFFYGAEEDANEYGVSQRLELLPDGGDILLRDAISSKTYKQLSF